MAGIISCIQRKACCGLTDGDGEGIHGLVGIILIRQADLNGDLTRALIGMHHLTTFRQIRCRNGVSGAVTPLNDVGFDGVVTRINHITQGQGICLPRSGIGNAGNGNDGCHVVHCHGLGGAAFGIIRVGDRHCDGRHAATVGEHMVDAFRSHCDLLRVGSVSPVHADGMGIVSRINNAFKVQGVSRAFIHCIIAING